MMTKNALPAILLAFLLVLVQGEPTKEDFDSADKICSELHNISKDEVAELMKQGFLNNTDKVDKKFKCYLYCLAGELGALGSDGYLDVEELTKSEDVKPAQLLAITHCKDEHDGEEDTCEYAFNISVCILKNLNESK
ncbi:general odorant-binding protein 57c-like [Drosophila grimshawi]|uniref:general odorant-binding protein 57c-like n=1 Tax=Drosophila grimshawi TaxID=7222 RepID=UPI000C8715A0|nr:general odorant-binding protein 57c-like [Drosophila grimshawi]